MTLPFDSKRILIKISGESLMGDNDFGHDLDTIKRVCSEIKKVLNLTKKFVL